MRICLVSQEYPPETGHGGIATQTQLKAAGLARLGHDVVVVSHSADRARTETVRDGVRVVRLPPPDERTEIRTDAVRWLEWSSDVAREIDRLHAETAIDLVDVPDYGGEGFHLALNRTAASPRVVVHLHGSVAMLTNGLAWPEAGSDLHRVGTFMEGTCIRAADLVYSSSTASAIACERNYGVPAASIPVVHSGIDLDALQPVAIDRVRPTIGFVGKVGPSKGADVVVEAACALAADVSDLRAILFGPAVGDWPTRLACRASEAGHPDLVSWRGPLARDDFAREVSSFDVFCSPSPFEAGPGFVFMEAMACGVPVIGCRGTGIEDVVHEGENGALVPIGDAGALAEALRRLLLDPGARLAMGQRARRWVEENADTTVCVRRIASLYERVVAGASA
jgi:glycosyltransferase involved in cell wall biosynthesis